MKIIITIMISKFVCLSIPALRTWNSNKFHFPFKEVRRSITHSQPKYIKYVQFLRCEDPDQIHVGYVVDEKCVVDLNSEDLKLPFSMIEVLRDPLALKTIET